MNTPKALNVLALMLTWLLLFSIPVSAAEEGFTLIDREEDGQSTSNTALTLLLEESFSEEVFCYAVSDSGKLAVGMKTIHGFSISWNNTIINVYDAENRYLYGFAFRTNGDCSFEWDNDNIALYYVRGNIAKIVNAEGEVLAVKDIASKTLVEQENNRQYWRYLDRPEKEANGFTYLLERSSIISRVNSDDETEVVFDISRKHSRRLTIYLILAFLFFVFFLYSFFKKHAGK